MHASFFPCLPEPALEKFLRQRVSTNFLPKENGISPRSCQVPKVPMSAEERG